MRVLLSFFVLLIIGCLLFWIVYPEISWTQPATFDYLIDEILPRLLAIIPLMLPIMLCVLGLLLGGAKW